MKVFVEQLVIRRPEFENAGSRVRPIGAARRNGRELALGRPPRRQDIADRNVPTGVVDDINDRARDARIRRHRRTETVLPRPRVEMTEPVAEIDNPESGCPRQRQDVSPSAWPSRPIGASACPD